MSFARRGASTTADLYDIELQRPKRLHIIREKAHQDNNIHENTNASSNVGFVDYGEEKLNAYMREKQRMINSSYLSGGPTAKRQDPFGPDIPGDYVAYGMGQDSVRVKQPADVDPRPKKVTAVSQSTMQLKSRVLGMRPQSAVVPSMRPIPQQVTIKQGTIPLVVYDNNSTTNTNTNTNNTNSANHSKPSRVRPHTATINNNNNPVASRHKLAVPSYNHLLHPTKPQNIVESTPAVVLASPAKKNILQQFRSSLRAPLSIEGVNTVDVHGINPQQALVYTNYRKSGEKAITPSKKESCEAISNGKNNSTVHSEEDLYDMDQPLDIYQNDKLLNSSIAPKSRIPWRGASSQEVPSSISSTPIGYATMTANSMEEDLFIHSVYNMDHVPTTKNDDPIVFDLDGILEAEEQQVKHKIDTVIDHKNTVMISRPIIGTRMKRIMTSPQKLHGTSDHKNEENSINEDENTNNTDIADNIDSINEENNLDKEKQSQIEYTSTSTSNTMRYNSNHINNSHYTSNTVKYTFTPHKEQLMAQAHIIQSQQRVLVESDSNTSILDDDLVSAPAHFAESLSTSEQSNEDSDIAESGEIAVEQVQEDWELDIAAIVPKFALKNQIYCEKDNALLLVNLPPTDQANHATIQMSVPVRAKPLVYDVLRTHSQVQPLIEAHTQDQRDLGMGVAYKASKEQGLPTEYPGQVHFSDIAGREVDEIGVYKKVYSRPQSAVNSTSNTTTSNSRPQSAMVSKHKSDHSMLSNTKNRPQSAVLTKHNNANKNSDNNSKLTQSRPQSAIYHANKANKSRPQSAISSNSVSNAETTPQKLKLLSSDRPVHSGVTGATDVLQIFPKRMPATMTFVNTRNPKTTPANTNNDTKAHDFKVRHGQLALLVQEQAPPLPVEASTKTNSSVYYGPADLISTPSPTKDKASFASYKRTNDTLTTWINAQSTREVSYATTHLPKVIKFLSSVRKQYPGFASTQQQHTGSTLKRVTTVRPQSAFCKEVTDQTIGQTPEHVIKIVESTSTKKPLPIHRGQMLGSARLAQYYSMLVQEGRIYTRPHIATAVANTSIADEKGTIHAQEVAEVIYMRGGDTIAGTSRKKKRKKKSLQPRIEDAPLTENPYVLPSAVDMTPLVSSTRSPFENRARKVRKQPITSLVSQYLSFLPKDFKPQSHTLEQRLNELETQQKQRTASSFPESQKALIDGNIYSADITKNQYNQKDKFVFQDLQLEAPNAAKIPVRPVIRPEDIQIPLESRVNELVEAQHHEVFQEVTKVQHRTEYVKNIGVTRAEADKVQRERPEQVDRLKEYGLQLDAELKTNPYLKQKYLADLKGVRDRRNPKYQHDVPYTREDEKHKTNRGWSAKMRDLVDVNSDTKSKAKTSTSNKHTQKDYYVQDEGYFYGTSQLATPSKYVEYGNNSVNTNIKNSINANNNNNTVWGKEAAQRQLDAARRKIDERFHAQLEESRKQLN